VDRTEPWIGRWSPRVPVTSSTARGTAQVVVQQDCVHTNRGSSTLTGTPASGTVNKGGRYKLSYVSEGEHNLPGSAQVIAPQAT
jgi:hypothetical protein